MRAGFQLDERGRSLIGFALDSDTSTRYMVFQKPISIGDSNFTIFDSYKSIIHYSILFERNDVCF